MYFVYILRCEDGTLYTGITTDPGRRLEEHRNGKGGNYTRARKGEVMAYTEPHPDRSSALKRELEIKRWPRKRKLDLISTTHS
jgi:putative endonuclease